MFDTKYCTESIILPSPVPCDCGGMQLPLYIPVILRDFLDMEGHGIQTWHTHQIIWKCNRCDKTIKEEKNEECVRRE